MATTNFQVFDSNNTNMMNDADYQTDTNRQNGCITNEVADPTEWNKALHQSTVMAAAIAQFLVEEGQNAPDTDLTTLTASISAAITNTIKSNIPNITSGTAEPSGGNDGDIYIMYTA